MKYIPSLRSFTSVFFNELLFNISKSTTMRFEVKTRSIEHMHIFFVFSSSFPFSFWIWDAWSLRFLCFFHKVITLKVSPRIRSLLLIRIVILPLFFLSFFFICLFTRSSLRHRVLKRQTATVRLGEIWLRTSFLLHFYIFIPPSYK